MLTEDTPKEPLAIVGIGCRLPGGADSAERLWELLRSETDATRVVPETRWNAARYHDPNPGKVGKIVTSRGGFLSEIDQFDPQFFGISPREANLLDPQQRLLLQATWEALDGSRLTATQLAVAPSGAGNLPYQLVKANPASGSGALVGVTYIQRVALKGGVAPAAECGTANRGQRATVGYQADYLFWKAL